MIPGNFRIVSILVVLFFLVPILINIYKAKFWNKIEFQIFVKIINKSLILQVIILVVGVLTLLVINNFVGEFIFKDEIAGSVITYFVIGGFCYLPSVVLLNLIKFLLKKFTK